MPFRVTWSTIHFFRLLGAIFDVIGVVMIAISVIKIEEEALDVSTLEELENELNAERASEGQLSIVGTVFILGGFICILVGEILSWVEHSQKAHQTVRRTQALELATIR